MDPESFYKAAAAHQPTFLMAVAQRGFIIGSVDAQGTVSFSANPKVHQDKTTASQEVDRLAAQYPGKAFFYSQLSGAVLYPAAKKQVF